MYSIVGKQKFKYFEMEIWVTLTKLDGLAGFSENSEANE